MGVEHLKGASGKWYQQSTDIDVVGISAIENTAVIGECKFKNERIDKGIYEHIILCARKDFMTFRINLSVLKSLEDW